MILDFGHNPLQNVDNIHTINLTNAASNSIENREGTNIIHVCQYNVLAEHGIRGEITLDLNIPLQTSVSTSEHERPRLGRNPFLGFNQHQPQGGSAGTSTN